MVLNNPTGYLQIVTLCASNDSLYHIVVPSIFHHFLSFCFQCFRHYIFGWWIQPIWKIWVKLDHVPKDRGENKTSLKPPPSIICFISPLPPKKITGRIRGENSHRGASHSSNPLALRASNLSQKGEALRRWLHPHPHCNDQGVSFWKKPTLQRFRGSEIRPENPVEVKVVYPIYRVLGYNQVFFSPDSMG